MSNDNHRSVVVFRPGFFSIGANFVILFILLVFATIAAILTSDVIAIPYLILFLAVVILISSLYRYILYKKLESVEVYSDKLTVKSLLTYNNEFQLKEIKEIEVIKTYSKYYSSNYHIVFNDDLSNDEIKLSRDNSFALLSGWKDSDIRKLIGYLSGRCDIGQQVKFHENFLVLSGIAKKRISLFRL